ncbi:endonuclease MutS2 [Dehalococcoidia bacterium]|nr:endonuclease MutS2 [Dehalococcoidia bacterium]
MGRCSLSTQEQFSPTKTKLLRAQFETHWVRVKGTTVIVTKDVEAAINVLRDKALRILEFDAIRRELGALTSFTPSEELALTMVPPTDFSQAMELQQETTDALRLLESRPNLSIHGAKDIRKMVQAGALGGQLNGLELLQIADTLSVIHFLKAGLIRAERSLPALGPLGLRFGDFQNLVEAIKKTVGKTGELVDSASKNLSSIRQEEQSTQSRLQARLQDIVTSTLGRQVLQEPFITTRDDRYVLAVKSEMRGQIQGLIHDLSSSGATVFMEPLATVELGNAWRELKIAERREIDRILRELTSQVGTVSEEILRSLEVLARVDLALAKAQLATEMQATMPELLQPGNSASATTIRLRNARHPLLSGDVVPIAIDLGKDFHTLVISGPNTGGKTVTLKTIGLLALMAQAGMAVPTDEGSAVTVFDGIYADIGDEQSIQQSLSTFSSHMGTIVQILREATSNSLVLLDELGAGTDPQDGTAIARAILSKLAVESVTTVVTTHHSELKAFAHSTPGLENASVEFDPVNLTPTYRLLVGIPGKSNALAIAEGLGLPQEIIDQARESIGETQAEVDALLGQIQEERTRIESERAAAQELHRKLELEKAEIDSKAQEIEREGIRIAMLRRAEVQVLAEEIKARLRHLGRRINALVGDKGRQELASIQADAQELTNELDGAKWGFDPKKLSGENPLTTGDRVTLHDSGQTGEILSPPDNKQLVDVQVGGVRLRMPWGRVKGKDLRPEPIERKVRLLSGPVSRATVGPEFWAHGMRAQQAVEAVDEYLEKAALAGHSQVRIIHGKGKWILRSAIQRALGDHPLVGMFRDGAADEGGAGVTIVEL